MSLKDWLAWGDRDAVAQIDSNWANHFGTPGADSFAGSYRYVEPSNYNINGLDSNAMVLVVEDTAKVAMVTLVLMLSLLLSLESMK